MDSYPPKIDVRETGTATTFGGYANTGVHYGDVNLRTGAPVRTSYHQQLLRIAPIRLVDRENELAQLAEFCLSPATSGRYAWWRADAWSGKTALMSWFVLHPPLGVRIVSFFITARLSSQSDRSAFIDNVLEQLLSFLGEELPPLLTEHTREAHLLNMLSEAAQLCHARGEQFILLVDGLDEDRGVDDEADAYSIAGILPPVLPSNMRVIVSGRPNPPIPADVSEHHPIRNENIVRHLSSSPSARAVQVDMERDLKKLLRGEPGERDLLGLVAAAGGGLTAADLADLTTRTRWEVNDLLRTVAGRSFNRRNSHYRPGDAPDVYLLGHEEIQLAAEEMLGEERLSFYRHRLHEWAAKYQSAGWPADTPEYLLRGYFNILIETGDFARAVNLTVDVYRHQRMLDLSGGDAAAINEIARVHKSLLSNSRLDLASIARLAIHRDRLVGLNSQLPARLPAVWAKLGKVNRAEAIANSLADLSQRVKALLFVLESLRGSQDNRRITELIGQSELAARSIVDHGRKAEALLAVVQAAVDCGELDHAQAIAEAISEPDQKAHAKLAVVRAAANTGQLDRARLIAESICESDPRSSGLLVVVESMSANGRHLDAKLIVDKIDSGHRTWAISVLAKSSAAAGEFKFATAVANSIGDTGQRYRILNLVAVEAALAGRHESFLDICDSVSNSYYRADLLTCSAKIIAEQGRISEAVEYLDQAQQAVGLVDNAALCENSLHSLVEAAAICGEFDRASLLADAILDPSLRANSLAMTARIAVKHGIQDQVPTLLSRAADAAECVAIQVQREKIIASISEIYSLVLEVDSAQRFAAILTISERQTEALSAIAVAYARMREFDRAIDTARGISTEHRKSLALASITREALKQESFEAAFRCARMHAKLNNNEWLIVEVCRSSAVAGSRDLAERFAASISDQNQRIAAISSVSVEFARIGDLDRSVHAARRITNPLSQATVLTELAEVAVGQSPDLAISILVDAHAVCRTVSSRGRYLEALAKIAVVVAKAGDFALAEMAIETLSTDLEKAESLKKVAESVALIGKFEIGVEIARKISNAEVQSAALQSIAEIAVVNHGVNKVGLVRNNFSDAEMRIRLFSVVARVAAEQRRLDEIDDMVNLLERAVESNTDPGLRALACGALAINLCYAGRYESALEWARSIGDFDRLSITEETIVEVASVRGKIDFAITVASSIRSFSRRENALEGVSRAAAAHRRFDLAESVALSIGDAERRIKALLAVGASLVEVGNVDLSRDIVRQASILVDSQDVWDFDLAWKIRNSLAVAHAAADVRDFDLFGSLVQRMQVLSEADPNQKKNFEGRVLASLVGHLVAIGEPERAESIANSALTDGGRARILVAAARGLVKVGMSESASGFLDKAYESAKLVADRKEYRAVLVSIGGARALMGELSQAVPPVDFLSDPYQRAFALTSAVADGNRHGPPQWALEVLTEAKVVACRIALSYQRDRALLSIVRIAVSVGLFGFAATIPSLIHLPPNREKAYLFLIDDDDEDRRDRVMAEALLSNRWHEVVRIFVGFPSAQLAEFLLELGKELDSEVI